MIWDWELDSEFDGNLLAFTQYSPRSVNWVDWLGNPVGVNTGVTVLDPPDGEIDQIFRGEKLGDPAILRFRDPGCFRAEKSINIVISGSKLRVILRLLNKLKF